MSQCTSPEVKPSSVRVVFVVLEIIELMFAILEQLGEYFKGNLRRKCTCFRSLQNVDICRLMKLTYVVVVCQTDTYNL